MAEISHRCENDVTAAEVDALRAEVTKLRRELATMTHSAMAAEPITRADCCGQCQGDAP